AIAIASSISCVNLMVFGTVYFPPKYPFSIDSFKSSTPMLSSLFPFFACRSCGTGEAQVRPERDEEQRHPTNKLFVVSQFLKFQLLPMLQLTFDLNRHRSAF